MNGKRQRQQRILEVLARNRIDNQEQLQDLLLAEGQSSTQSTLSRDLRELGIVKGPEGYRVLAADSRRSDPLKLLKRSLRGMFAGVDAGGNIVVLRAKNENARSLASELEKVQLHQVVCAVPCDDTVLIVTRTPAQAREVVRLLQKVSR